MTKKLITTQQELDDLEVGAHVWGSSRRFPDVPGSGSPYEKLSDEWWDYGNDYAVGFEDIMLPAVLVWDGVA